MKNEVEIIQELQKKHLAVYNDGNIDPNTTLKPLILTKHINAPNKGANFYYVKTMFFSKIAVDASRTQIAFGYNTNQIYERTCYNGQWQGWREYLSVAEVITNTNGTATKYSDGTMKCEILISISNFAINTQYGSLYTNTWQWNYPAEFVENPFVSCGQFKLGNYNSWGAVSSANKQYAILQCMDVLSRAAGPLAHIRATATGKWK